MLSCLLFASGLRYGRASPETDILVLVDQHLDHGLESPVRLLFVTSEPTHASPETPFVSKLRSLPCHIDWANGAPDTTYLSHSAMSYMDEETRTEIWPYVYSDIERGRHLTKFDVAPVMSRLPGCRRPAGVVY